MSVCVSELSVKQDCFPGYSCPMPGTRRCPLPPIEAARNGLPCSHGGRTGTDNGRAGWSPDHILWWNPYIHKQSMPPNPAILTQTLWLSSRDNDACRKRKPPNLHTDNNSVFPSYCLHLLMESEFILNLRLKQISALWFTYFKHLTLKMLFNHSVIDSVGRECLTKKPQALAQY